MADTLTVRAAAAADRMAVTRLLTDSWGSTTVVAHGVALDASALPALMAERDGAVCGLLTYQVTERGLEVVSLDATVRWSGAGTALLAEAVRRAREAGAPRLWLVTSNDNLDALRFYQRRGLRIAGVSAGAVDAARELKPSIPLRGHHGIELHDEIVMELDLTAPEAGSSLRAGQV
ncbi:GNAT family N-acetyltransferase [Streptomyces sp. NRRL F-5126]|uniref:GNAT family N-acetyltransferase n=1 Tax=Streptomyces sp. NRRL F-5126 TaxID=1463857 RepID=UPI00068E5360|nr:GNAT family N-acetyltransferase [Streptomyces sp. NRRL F-5126]